MKQANADIEAWCIGMCDAAEKAIATGTAETPGDYPTVYGQLRTMMLKEASKIRELEKPAETPTEQHRLEIASEMLDQLAAGFDTSGITLTYLAWELSRPRNASVQKALRKELGSLSPTIRAVSESGGKKALTDPKDMDALPMLHAVVMETLRLHAAIPGGQPRVTPANATLGEGATAVHGTSLPQHAHLCDSSCTLTDSPQVFPQEFA